MGSGASGAGDVLIHGHWETVAAFDPTTPWDVQKAQAHLRGPSGFGCGAPKEWESS